jgi:hypothetical protein
MHGSELHFKFNGMVRLNSRPIASSKKLFQAFMTKVFNHVEL